ncbi:Formin-H [Hondaea fermentalgiana]|uniref:Formin-H n=1 Tax=Hondaea fermentalgiana TaxID=2315210 RepID=A0A2R5G7T1_9STRA|nr:Formin-H [Hondaea fermentalgiana]|eukprot:GBG26605.1 Formin-H [Hondaea fermentalgiana]
MWSRKTGSKRVSRARTTSVDDEERPTGAKLDELFAAALEAMALPEATRTTMMREQSPAKKWDLIKAHKSMVKNDENEARSGASAEKRNASFWVDLISRRRSVTSEPVITVSEAGELYAVMRTAHKQFLLDFIDADGVSVLIDLTRWYTGRADRNEKESQILPQIMSCYKALMNNRVGMEAVLSIPDSITTFALGMDLSDPEHLQTAQEVVMLLAVTCFYSIEGREKVVRAMDDLRLRWREKHRFQTLVETFADCGDNEFRAAVSMLITTVVNSASRVEDRVRVRNDFLALDIMGVFERVLQEASDEDDQSYATIATQFQVFEDMLAEDHKEVTFALISGTSSLDDAEIDLSNQEHVFDYLLRSAQAAGCADLLLETSQTLLLIPSERTLAVPTWEGVARFVSEATDYSRRSDTGKGLRLNYQILSELLDKRAELDERLGQMSSGQDIIGQQRQKIKDLESQLRGSSGGNQAKNGSRKAAQAAAAAAASAAKGVSGRNSAPEEVTILQGQIIQLRDEITSLQKKLAESHKGKPVEEDLDDADKPSATAAVAYTGKLDSTGLAPAGLIPGAKPSPIPACPLPNMPGSLELAPIPAKSGAKTKYAPPGPTSAATGGLAVAATAAAAAVKLKSAVADPPAAPGAGGPGALSSLFAARSAAMKLAPGGGAQGAAAGAGAGAAGPPRESEAEIRKRLGLQRKKAIHPTVKMKHIYWTPVPVEKLEGTVWPELSDQRVKLNIKMLERKFGTDPEVEKVAAAQSEKRKSLGKVHLVTGKRQQNVGIALSKIRASDAEIVDAILTMDDTLLSPEHTVVLLTAVPTEDEIQLIRNFQETSGDPRKLAREDQFLLAVSSIPGLKGRLEAVACRHNFESDTARIFEKIRLVREACIEISKSKQLQQLLEIVLAVGNYLNGDTPRGGAWGFKLDALGKLDTIKDNKGKSTLMDFIYAFCEDKYPQLCDFSLPASKEAMDVSLSDTMSELNQLAAHVRAIKTELGNPPVNKRDRFVKAMTGFEIKASKEVADLQTQFEKVRSDFQHLAREYAETGAAVEPETFFSKFVRFEMALHRSRRLVEEQRERAERARRLAEEKQRRATLKKLRETGGHDEGVFAAFHKANAGNAQDIVQGFRQRNQVSGQGRPSRRGSNASAASKKSRKKKTKVKIIRTVGPDGEVIIKKVKLKKKKKKAVSSVPNAEDYDMA